MNGGSTEDFQGRGTTLYDPSVVDAGPNPLNAQHQE